MPNKQEIPIAEGVRIKCELCSGTGKRQQINFRENDAGSHEINCYLCTGKGWVYAPQDEMAERISSLAHQLSQEKERNAALREAAKATLEICEEGDTGAPFERVVRAMQKAHSALSCTCRSHTSDSLLVNVSESCLVHGTKTKGLD